MLVYPQDDSQKASENKHHHSMKSANMFLPLPGPEALSPARRAGAAEQDLPAFVLFHSELAQLFQPGTFLPDSSQTHKQDFPRLIQDSQLKSSPLIAKAKLNPPCSPMKTETSQLKAAAVNHR